MNEEINKIIKDLEFCDDLFDYTINPKQCKILLNYINDLEQEKNKIIFDSNGLINANGILQQENQELKEKLKATNKGLRKVINRSNKYKHKFYNSKHIIDELEKWLKSHLKHTENIIGVGSKIDYESCYEIFDENQVYKVAYNSILNKLQELKGSDN